MPSPTTCPSTCVRAPISHERTSPECSCAPEWGYPDYAELRIVGSTSVARRQIDAATPKTVGGEEPDAPGTGGEGPGPGGGGGTGEDPPDTSKPAQPTRFHGTVALDEMRVGLDASRIADEIISHLTGMVGANVTVTLEIEAEVPSGAPDHVVRTVTENSRTLKFTSQGFEQE